MESREKVGKRDAQIIYLIECKEKTRQEGLIMNISDKEQREVSRVDGVMNISDKE